jgi:signal transduction histidine kinase
MGREGGVIRSIFCYNIEMSGEKPEMAKARTDSVFSHSIRVGLVLAVTALVAAGITFIMYGYTQDLLKEGLQTRLISVAATAASQFDAETIESIQSIDDIDSQSFEILVEQLNEIRSASTDIQYAYLMRRTDDPLVVEFIADADSLLTEEELDANENGIVDDDEWAPLPGDPYEIEEYPVLKDEAFYHPAVDRELQEDQWGMIMAAYAPIFNSNGETVAIVGIDVLVDNFNRETQATLLPFSLFIFVLILLLTLLSLLLIRFYTERVEIMHEIDRQKDELLSIVSHQLATPISSTKWYLEMLQDGDVGKLSGEQKKHVKSIQGIAENLTDLVGMILDVSRIQLGRMQVDREALNLNKFFDEILAVIEPKAAEQKVKFNVSIPKKLPIAMLDRRLMRMTVENLLSNAVKYTPEKGTVEFTVEQRGNSLWYKVKDTGCGIPKAEHKKMFTKLYRASNVRSVSGNGFGLYVAKGAVEAQDGSINFRSARGKGTTFEVQLPIVKPNKS